MTPVTTKTEDPTADEAVTDDAADEQPEPEQEVITPEVVEVDTSRPVGEDEGAADPREQSVTALPVKAEPMGLIPMRDELRGVAELAVTLALAGNVPKALRERPADVMAVILTGRELGVAPMTAIRTFYVIEGQVTVAPKVRMAMVRQQKLGKLWPDPGNNNEQATWYAERADQPGQVFRSTYTLAMAKSVKTTIWKNGNKTTASLADKDNWQAYPERMLSWRAVGYLLDDCFPEVGTGLYSPDELGAVTDEEGHPILDVDSTEALVAKTSGEQRRGPTPDAPPDPPADQSTIETFQARIDAISRHGGGAREALLEMWTAPDDQGVPKLPPLGKLMAKQAKMASAMIDAIERRITRGDFGEAATGDTAPAAADSTDPVEVPTDAPSGPQEPQEPVESGTYERSERPAWVDRVDVASLPLERTPKADLMWLAQAPDEMIARIAADVKAITLDELDLRLKAAGLPTTGKADAKMARLAAWVTRREMEKAIG